MANIVTPQKLDIYEEDIAYRSAVSEELLRKFAASINAINRDALMPLGTILTSMLPEAQFQLITSTAWVMVKGQVITTTDYGQFLLAQGLDTGTVILPDARGMHLVGINNGRSDGKQHVQNPTLGGFIEGQLKAHTHTYLKATITPGNSDYYLGGTHVGMYDPQTLATSSVGQTQNTVNALGVNYFIKVWNVAP